MSNNKPPRITRSKTKPVETLAVLLEKHKKQREDEDYYCSILDTQSDDGIPMIDDVWGFRLEKWRKKQADQRSGQKANDSETVISPSVSSFIYRLHRSRFGIIYAYC